MGRGRVGRLRLGVVALVLIGTALAGCGGGGGDAGEAGSTSTTSAAPSRSATTSSEARAQSGEGPPKELGSPAAVRTVIETVLTSIDPADACGKHVTRHYLWVAYGGRQACVQAQRPGIAARSLSSLRIEREDEQGTAVSASALLRGGPYDGTRAKVGLVFDSGRYQVNSLGSNVPVGP